MTLPTKAKKQCWLCREEGAILQSEIDLVAWRPTTLPAGTYTANKRRGGFVVHPCPACELAHERAAREKAEKVVRVLRTDAIWAAARNEALEAALREAITALEDPRKKRNYVIGILATALDNAALAGVNK